jgi:cytochrome b involved in lipid metabolism|tara:strand:- start:866 stop:1078 length:213 start_codon:yes stop_codon:yes gene_type:complete
MQESKKIKSLVENANGTFYTLEEVAQHTAQDDCWTIYKGKVYDVTEYAKVHPGGKKIFLGKGKDCTALYD